MDYDENGDLVGGDEFKETDDFNPNILDDDFDDLDDDFSGDEAPEGFRFDDGDDKDQEETY